LQDYLDGLDTGRGLGKWFPQYNTQRPHQALRNATPAQWYQDAAAYGAKPAAWSWKRF